MLLCPLATQASSIAVLGVTRGVNREDEGERIEMAELAIAVRVRGLSADVTVHAVLANRGDDPVEGRFLLDLPVGAVVTGYALDVNGHMIPGQLVEQPKARQVYEDSIRAGIDPGLAEVTARNQFQARVFPIAENGQRTIDVHFSVALGNTGSLVWPLDSDAPIGRVLFKLDAAALASAPTVNLPVAAQVKPLGERAPWKLAWEGANQRLVGALRVTGARPIGPAIMFGHSSGSRMFDLSDRLPRAPAGLEKPRRVRIYWDTSRSRRESLHDDERALVRDYLAWAGPIAVDVVRFSSGTPSVSADLDASGVDRLLSENVWRGTTSLAGLDRLDLKQADQCLLFTDGELSLDQDSRFRPDCPLAVIASGPGADGSGAARIAEDRHARFVRLAAGSGAQALAALRSYAAAVIAVRDDYGADLEFTALPAGPGEWRVMGEAPVSGDIHVTLEGVPYAQREQSYSIGLVPDGKLDAPGALWAARKVAKLDRDPTAHAAMLKLARRFSVASPSLAFLVLERPGQYLAAGVRPPDGFDAGWMDDYREQSKDREQAKGKTDQDRTDKLLDGWQAMVAWWEKSFDQQAAFAAQRKRRPNREAVEEAGANRRSEQDRAAPMASPAPPPPPALMVAPMAPAPEPDDQEMAQARAEIVVTGVKTERGMAQSMPLAITAVSTDALGQRVVQKVDIKNLLSDRPYLRALRAAAPADRMRVLAEQEQAFGILPGFYFDTGEWFRQQGDTELARTLMLSAIDLPVANDETRALAAFRLQAMGEHDRAIELLERMAANTDYRPQPKRLLALALVKRAAAQPARAKADLERAFALLVEVAFGARSRQYYGIDMTALMVANALIPRLEAVGGSWKLDQRFVHLLDADVRIVIDWTSPDADVDLWVTEPTGEQVGYSHQRSDLGGAISDDMTDGYGPEQYFLRRAAAGAFAVRAQGFSPDAINPNGASRVMVHLFRDFGRPTQREEVADTELGFDRADRDENDKVIATIRVGEGQ